MSLLDALRVRLAQGHQTIDDVRAARPAGLRALPVISERPCPSGCRACVDACPTTAVRVDGAVAIDLGACVFCGDCGPACPEGAITWTPDPRLGATSRDALVRTARSSGPPAVEPSAISRRFGRSLRLRQVSAGGCSACELELGATANPNFDVSRFGIEWVASPRHADALVVTGPVTQNMADALARTWSAVPEPKFVVAVGACAISGGLYAGSPRVAQGALDALAPSLFVPGCPPHPLTFVHALLDFIEHRR